MELSGTTIWTVGGDSLSLILDLLNAHHLCKLLYTGDKALWNSVIANCRTLIWSKPLITRNPVPVKVPSFLPLLRNVRWLELAPFEADGTSRAIVGMDPKTFSPRLKSLKIRANNTLIAAAPTPISAQAPVAPPKLAFSTPPPTEQERKEMLSRAMRGVRSSRTSAASSTSSATPSSPASIRTPNPALGIAAATATPVPKMVGFGFGFGLGANASKPSPPIPTSDAATNIANTTESTTLDTVTTPLAPKKVGFGFGFGPGANASTPTPSIPTSGSTIKAPNTTDSTTLDTAATTPGPKKVAFGFGFGLGASASTPSPALPASESASNPTKETESTTVDTTTTTPAPKKVAFGFGFGLGASASKPPPAFFSELTERCPDLEELVLDDKTGGITSTPFPLPINLRILSLPCSNLMTLDVVKHFPRGIVYLDVSLSSVDPARAEHFSTPNSIFPPKLTALTLMGTIKTFVYDHLPPTLTSFKTSAELGEAQIAKLPPTLLVLVAAMQESMLNIVPRSITELSYYTRYIVQDAIKSLPPGLIVFERPLRSNDHSILRQATDEYVQMLPAGLVDHIGSIGFTAPQLAKLPRRLSFFKLLGDTSTELAGLPTVNLRTLISSFTSLGQSWLRSLPRMPVLKHLGLACFGTGAGSMDSLDFVLNANPSINKLELAFTQADKAEKFELTLTPPGQLEHLTFDLHNDLSLQFNAPWAAGVHTLVLANVRAESHLELLGNLPPSVTDFSLLFFAAFGPPPYYHEKHFLNLPRGLLSFTTENCGLIEIDSAFIQALPKSLTVLNIATWQDYTVPDEVAREHLPPSLTDVGDLVLKFPPPTNAK